MAGTPDIPARAASLLMVLGASTFFIGFGLLDTRWLVNPALVLLLIGAVGLWRQVGAPGRLRAAGAMLVAAGLLGMLIGNLLEYGPFPSLVVFGWEIFLLGSLAIGPLGALLLSIAELRGSTLAPFARSGLVPLAAVPLVTLGFGGVEGSAWTLGGLAFLCGWVLAAAGLWGRAVPGEHQAP